MNEIVRYIDRVFETIPDSQRKAEMREEIIERLEDSADAWVKRGKQRDDAVNKAIVEFGELSEILLELRAETSHSKETAGKQVLLFSIAGSVLIIALTAFINLYYTPQYIWFLYPAFAVLWWPLSIFFFGKWRKGDH